MPIFVWGTAATREYAFLKGSPIISETDRRRLVDAAVEMFYGNVNELDVGGENYEGRLVNTRKYGMLGEFGGWQFEAELETDSGRTYIKFLIREEGRMEVSTDKMAQA